MRSVAIACALLLTSGCGPGEPGPGDEAILVDPDHRSAHVLLWVEPAVDPSGMVRVPIGTRVRVVEERPPDPASPKPNLVVNVLEGPRAGTAGAVARSQLGPAR